MMNSPCAMLMTFIWPNVNVRPSATSSRIDAMLSPAKNWLKKSSIASPPPLVARCRSAAGVGRRQALGPVVRLQARIRLDRLGALADSIGEPAFPPLPDGRGLGDVL